MLNPGHELILLANKIDWPGMEAEFMDTYCPDFGAPAKAIRLMVGLHYLKYAFDESVVARWGENPYWQYFCGYTHMQHECPIHPTSMTKWRSRLFIRDDYFSFLTPVERTGGQAANGTRAKANLGES